MKYIDLDGVLADLKGWLLEIDPQALEVEENFFRIALEKYDRIFLESEPIRENFRLVEGEYRILTALPHPQNYFKHGIKLGLKVEEIARRHSVLFRNKLLWCVEHGIPAQNVIIVEARKLKQAFARPADTLYDDSEKTIQEWNAVGALGILVK